MLKIITILLLNFLLKLVTSSNTYFISLSGSDNSGDGTLLKPFATLKRASHFLKPGDKCFYREGVYYI